MNLPRTMEMDSNEMLDFRVSFILEGAVHGEN